MIFIAYTFVKIKQKLHYFMIYDFATIRIIVKGVSRGPPPSYDEAVDPNGESSQMYLIQRICCKKISQI